MDEKKIATTAEHFLAQHSEKGFKSISGSEGTWWIQHGPMAMVRFPTFCMDFPTKREIRKIHWSKRLPLASYILPDSPQNPANAYLYIRKPPYDKSLLERKPRQSINRAHKYLTIDVVDFDKFEKNGFPAFRDTRTRVGLSDGTMEIFQLNLDLFRSIDGHVIFGAWKGSDLLAFIIAAEIDDFCELALVCSQNGSLKWCPNNALYDAVFDYYLNRRKCRLVSAGLSSIQHGQNWKGLHSFKKHVGFNAIPVRRVFAIHPLLKPLINQFSYRILSGIGGYLPKNPLIRKGIGTFEKLLGVNPVQQARVEHEQKNGELHDGS